MEDAARILGVDDSLTIRKALELVLRPAGYNLELAASGAEAVEKARDFRPEVMLLDFILPDMRGTEVCRRLASDPETADIPVVLISAKGAEIRQAYQDVGNVVSYITKPFTPEDVTGVVAEVLARSREGALIRVEAPAAAPPIPPTAAPRVGIVPPPAPPPAVAAPLEPAEAADAWDEGEEAAEEEAVPAAVGLVAGRREALEVMFESLGAGLEGVYVEEVDTPAGAAADEAKSYTDLVAQLTRQLGETLAQARSGTRFSLSSDGSVRSLDDSLLDAYRRLCRLLFRAVVAGAVQQGGDGVKARVLVACHRDSELFETLQGLTRRDAEWSGLLVCERFRQLPMMTRLYGPTHLIVEVTRGGALLDQLKTLRRMPEARRMKIIAVVRSAAPPDPAVLAEVEPELVMQDGPDLLRGLKGHIHPAEQESPAGGAAEPSAAAL